LKLDWRREKEATATLLQIQIVGFWSQQRQQQGAWHPLPATGLASDFWARLIPLFERSEQEFSIQLEPLIVQVLLLPRVEKDLKMLST